MDERWQRPRGTYDVVPPEGRRIERFRRLFYEMAGRYGYQEIQTPVLEKTAVFVEGVGEATDIVQHERYTFVDAGGVSLTLRPEGTAAVARAYVEHGMATWGQPVRLFYWMPMFRRESPQAGRYRQHQQYGVELYGSPDYHADAEVILLAHRLLTAMGQEPLVRVNSIGCAVCRPGYREALVQYYTAHQAELCEDCQRRLSINPLRLLDCKKDVAVKAGAPDLERYWCDECRTHLESLLKGLGELSVQVRRDPYLVRGLDYYYRTVFEVDDARLGAQSTILAGGRYDGLAARFGGPPAPAVGWAAGVERLLMVLGDSFVGAVPKPVYVAQVGAGDEALRLAEALRSKGLAAETDVIRRSLKAQMKDAARRARYVVLAGGTEWAAGQVVVRDLTTREEVLLAVEDLASWIERQGPTGRGVDRTEDPI